MSIKETVESFIKFRRSIGRKDQSTTYSLRLFAKFIGETTELTSITESDCRHSLVRKEVYRNALLPSSVFSVFSEKTF
jgi:integrase/recombinase XerD